MNLATSLRKLRPGKARNALRRRWFEFQTERLELHDAPGTINLGSSYGAWALPTGLIEPSWVCYSVGVGGDITFDMELIQRYDMQIRAFEPVADYIGRALEQASGEPRFTAHQVAIATSDGPLRMQVTHDAQSQSVSPAGLYESSEFVEFEGRSLPSLMAELGDERIDVLKLDIEGGEYDLMPTLELKALGVKVFSIQLHHTGSVSDARKLIQGLREDGYVPVACLPPVRLTFARAELL
jgi:FkbM family methyltransferase